MDLEKCALKVLQLNEAQVGSAYLFETLYVPRSSYMEDLKGALVLRTHKSVGEKMVNGTIELALASGILKVGDVAIYLLVVVLGEHVYPVYLDPLDPDLTLAFNQVVRQESLHLVAIFDSDELTCRLYPFPSGGPFKRLAIPPENLGRWTPAQFSRAVEAVKQAFDGDIEGLLGAMNPKISPAELHSAMNLQADSPPR